MAVADRLEASPFAQLRAHLAARGAARRCRVLLIVANPLGNAIGDTLMAAWHLPMLRQLARRVDLTIWSGNAATWRFLDGSVRVVSLVSEEQWARDFDLIVVEGRAVAEPLLARAAASGVAVLQWDAGALRAVATFGAESVRTWPLPPASNMPAYLAVVYEALGFESTPPLRAATAPPIEDVAFLNPFASNVPRSLTPAFTRILLDALRPATPAATTWITQAGPTPYRHDDVDGYRRVAVVLDAEAAAGRLARRPMALTEYLRQVACARFVVGADTSSQHIAAAAGRPSIAFYPPLVTPGFYLVWGPTAPSCLHFIAPPDGEPARQRAVAGLVARILRVWCGETPAARDAAAARRTWELATRLVAYGRRYVDGERSVEASMTRTMARLRPRLAAPELEPVRLELELLCTELPRSGSPAPAARRAVTLRQLEALNSVKVLAWLAGVLAPPAGPANARRAGARRSADRAARSRARASQSPRDRRRAP